MTAVSNPVQENDRARALALTPVSRETLERLDRFVGLLLESQRQLNLISNSSVETVWTRHVADSLQLLELAPKARIWVDLGSGAGFPGLAIACALADETEAHIHVVESTLKKANFLSRVTDALGLPVTVHPVRIEDFVKRIEFRSDVVTARALAPLNRLLDLARPLLDKGAQGLFPKGQDVGRELTEATKYWSFEPTLVPSKTHPQSRIVCIRAVPRRKASKRRASS
jgi:16S rRNA (guanine527-N7)-methyltransferase